MNTKNYNPDARLTKKILILEPHLDDFEVGLSVWLKKMSSFKLDIHIVTFCEGRREQTSQERADRLQKRLDNLELFKVKYPNLKIWNWRMKFKDTELDGISMGALIVEFHKFFDSLVVPHVQNFDYFKEIYFPQEDLHVDHSIVNKIGKILTRNFKGKVFEYIIQNSNYKNDFTYNTEIKTEFTFGDDVLAKNFIEVCLYPHEKVYFQNIVHIQKGFDGKYISDKLNLIKDIFVASDRI